MSKARSALSGPCLLYLCDRPELTERHREAIADVINAAAFFSWANRLMLSIGEPAPPRLIPRSPA